MFTRRAFTAAGAASLAPIARAGALETPRGPVVLTVGGAIARRNDGDLARFDLAMLDAIEQTAFATATPWHDHRPRFEGVAGSTLVAALGATGSSVAAVALNDYSSTIPFADFAEPGLLIASRVDGRPMTVREKGPLWIVYPYDSSPKLSSGVYHGRSVWQLARLDFR